LGITELKWVNVHNSRALYRLVDWALIDVSAITFGTVTIGTPSGGVFTNEDHLKFN